MKKAPLMTWVNYAANMKQPYLELQRLLRHPFAGIND